MLKKIYILLLIVSVSACAQKVDSEMDVKAENSKVSLGISKEDAAKISEDQLNQATPYIENYPEGGIKVRGQKIGDVKVGKWTSYYKNGVIWSEGEYHNGAKSGKFKDYFADGMLRYKGAYVNDLKQGPWFFYDNQGKVIKKVKFHKGEMVEE